ncbi:MAG: hypothetical protein ACFB20_11470 [Opitutales bacterium]
MKSAYELAMERLAAEGDDTTSLTEEQKAELAEIDRRFQAKIAEREVFLQSKIKAADPAEAEKQRQELAAERKRLQGECEAAKDKVRRAAS